MNYLRFLSLILFSFSSLAISNFFSVKEGQKVRVIQDGKEHFLSKGDLVQIGNNNGWKREVTIVTTRNKSLKVGPAHLGEKTYKEHMKLSRLDEVKTNKKVVTKKMKVILEDGRELTLFPGDEILIKNKDSWKRKIEIVKGQSGKVGNAYLGEETYQKYIQDEILSSREETNPTQSEYFPKFVTLDDLIDRLRTEQDIQIDEEDLSSGVELKEEAISCPKEKQSYKLDRSIRFVAKEGKLGSIPRESIIRVTSSGATCEIELLKLPEKSVMKLSDYPKKMKTYPTNLEADFLEQVEDPAETVDLSKGVEFRVKENISLNAIGRKTGKSYKFDSTDTIQIQGVHRNGDYIVKRNNEPWEYRVSSDDLNEMNDRGLLNVDLESTANTIIADELIQETVDELETKVNCDNYVETSPDGESISWQDCRSKSVKTKNGKLLKANNYLEKQIPMSNMNADVILQDRQKRNFSRCISNSLRHGTNRNTSPSCEKNSKGEILPQRIRQAQYKTKNGKKKFARWDLLNRVPRACASKKLSTYLSDRFVDMSRCLGIDPKELFPIINHESHFQPNTVSPSFAIGVGQIVSANYVDFYDKLNKAKSMINRNSNVLKYTRNLSSEEGYKKYEDSPAKSKPVDRLTAYFLSDLKGPLTSNKRECSGLRNIYNNPMEMPKWAKKSQRDMFSYLRQRENQRVCMPKNPDEGLYMSAVYYMYNKKYFNYLINKESDKMRPRLSDSQRKEFSIILTRWSYNGGVAGISGPFERLLQKISEGKIEKLDKRGNPIKNKDGSLVKRSINSLADLSTQEFKNYMSYVIKYRYKSKSENRRNEVANYVVGDNGVGGIDGDLKQIEKGDAGSCGNSL
ncbi:transglycosylase SLT domain-containing protein [Halobacteriovorax sp. HLS]|uniref:transglycosylase SLT domain-containing protein n=1 Tax=Halobacteriovorax sp. HLS TaxID=2234000 RepID=UPI0013E3AF9C|nr:transglycosylase SLT domain-containing protein [Halobacteriovorax sp. HLS]